MARQTINIGTSANDGTGDPLRTAFDKINDNFAELYGADGDSNTLAADLDLNGNRIITSRSNEDIALVPSGTGKVIAGAFNFDGTKISVDDSTQITIAENVQTTGTLNVSGAATLATSLTIGTSTTISSIIDDDTMGTASDTSVATSESMKAYVDAQVTASDLDFTADDSTTNSIDLDSEVLEFKGGTGITTSATANQVNINIDSTVATLTGSQTLTNKTLTSPTIDAPTMTGTATVDNLSFNDNIITTASNADLRIDANGTGVIKPLAKIEADTVEIEGTNFDIDGGAIDDTPIGFNTANTGKFTTLEATTSITAPTLTLTNGAGATIDAVTINDNQITTSSNADLVLNPGGTGVTSVTGTLSVTGQVDFDNIRIDGNTISSQNSNGGISLLPNGTGTITLGASDNYVSVPYRLSANQVETTDITTAQSDTDLQITTLGTGVIDLTTPTQTTVGAVGAASKLPQDSANEVRPAGYLKIKIAGVDYVIPYFNAS